MISQIFKNCMIFIVNIRQSRFQYFYGIIHKLHLMVNYGNNQPGWFNYQEISMKVWKFIKNWCPKFATVINIIKKEHLYSNFWQDWITNMFMNSYRNFRRLFSFQLFQICHMNTSFQFQIFSRDYFYKIAKKKRKRKNLWFH